MAKLHALLAACALLALAACGGGGDSGAPAAGADEAATAPTSLPGFDLSHWKLDLPVDAAGGTGGANGRQFAARTVLPAQLQAGFVDPWFHADAQGRIVFTAPADGAVTTPGVGSDHTRSELREFEPGADANGDWTGSGTLAATCSVHAVASASPVAIIGQLRSEDQVLARLEYRPATRAVAIDVYPSHAAGSPHAATVIASNIDLDQSFDYSLSLADDVLIASVDGASRSFALDASWRGVPLYFKLGAYHTAPNTGNPPGDATVVRFERFSVRH